jgi:hypothetical protein
VVTAQLRFTLSSKHDAYHYGVDQMLFSFILSRDSFLAITMNEGSAFIFMVQDWCIEQFTDDHTRWAVKGLTFNFRDEVDALAFRLRWC